MNLSSTKFRIRFADKALGAMLAAVCVAMTPAPAEALTYTWTAGTTADASGAWATSTFNGQAYTASDDLIINGSATKTITLSGTILTPNSLTISGTGTTGNTITSNAGVAGAGAITLNGTSIGGTLNKTGNADLVLATANAFGAVTISGGKFFLNNAAGLGTTGTLTVNSGAANGVASAYAAATMGSFFYDSSNINADYAFSKNISFGTVSSATTYGMAMRGGASRTTTLSGNISGGSNITLWLDTSVSGDSASSWSLTGDNSGFAGTVQLIRGRLFLGNANAAGTGTIILQTNANAAGNLVFNYAGNLATNIAINTATDVISTNGNNVTLSGIVSGSAWVKAGTGTLTLTNTNTFTGVTINAGTLSLGSAGALGTTGTITFATGGTLQYSASNTTDYSSRFGTGVNQFSIDTNGQNVTFTTQIISATAGNASTLTKLGAGTLTLNSASSHYTGATTISGGTLSVGTLANIGSASGIGHGDSTSGATNAASLVFDGGTLKYTGATVAIDRAFTINTGKTATIDTANNLTLAGATGAATNGALTKEGAGALILNAANTYTGATTINNGTLTLAFGGVASNILATGSAVTLGNGTLSLTGTGTQATTNVATAAGTGSRIVMGTSETLAIGTLTVGTGSALNFNTVAGGANATTATLGSGVVTVTTVTFPKTFTVTDAGGFGLATLSSNNVVRNIATALLPASGAASPTDYRVDNNAGGAAAAGSSSLAVTASQSAGSITVDTTTANGTLTLNSAVVLSNNTWNFGGIGTNTYQITGGTSLTSLASGDAIAFNNYNSGTVTVASSILANGTNAVTFNGTGTTILSGTNTHTGGTTVNGGTLTLSGSRGTTGVGVVRGTLAVNSGATLNLSTGDALGYTAGVQVTTLNIGGTVNTTVSGNEGFITTVNLTGGTLSSTGLGKFYFFNTGFNSLASSTTSLISSPLDVQGSVPVNVALGSVSGGIDLNVSGVISNSGALTKSGLGTLNLSNYNTYSGGTTVSGGTLKLSVGGGTGTIRGVVTVNSGATLVGAVGDSLGYTVNSQVSTLNLVGGTFNLATGNQGYTTNVSMTGGTITSTGGGTLNFADTYNLTSNAATTTSLISGGIVIRTDGGTTSALSITVAAGNVTTGTTPGVDLNITGSISSQAATRGLTKSGLGTLQLTGNNSFSGGLIVNGGKVIAATSSMGTGAVTVNANARLSWTDSTYANFPGSSLTVVGGTFSFDGTTQNAHNFVSKTITLQGGTLTSVNGTAGPANDGSFGNFILNNSTLIVSGTAQSTISTTTLQTNGGSFNVGVTGAPVDLLVQSVISGGTVTKNGAGLMLLTGTNTYAGATTISNGTLVAGANAPSGSAGAFGNAATAIALGDATSISSNLSPSLLINGAFTVARTITVGSATTATTGVYTIGGSNTTGTATFTSPIALNQPVTLSQATGGTVEFITGTWATNDKAVTVGSMGNTGTVKLSSSLSTTGGVAINFGKLLLGTANALGNSTTPLSLAGSTAVLDLNGLVDTVGSLSGSSGSITGAAGSTLTVTQIAALTYGGTIGDSVNFIKDGASTLSLTGASTYTGGTNITNGTLYANYAGATAGTSSTGGGSVVVNSGGTLGGGGTAVLTGGQFNIAGAVTVNNLGTISPGTSTPGVLTVNNSVSLANGAIYKWKISGTVTGGDTNPVANGASSATSLDLLAVTSGTLLAPTGAGTAPVKFDITSVGSTVTLDPNQYYSFLVAQTAGTPDISGFSVSTSNATGTNSFADYAAAGGHSLTLTASGNNVYLNLSPVPEPTTILGLSAAGMGLAGWVRRRKFKTREAAHSA